MQSVHSNSSPGFLPARIGNTLPDIILSEINGEPRARDLDIAKRLGFERERAIRQLIERNLVELETFGLIATRRGAYRGSEFTEYWLTEEQALLVASRSDAENAPAVRRMLIKVFVAWRRGHMMPTQPLTPAEMFLQNAQAMVAIERQQAEQGEQIKALDAKVDQVAQAHVVLDKLPSNCELITYIRRRINKQFGLSEAVVNKVMWDCPYSPTVRVLVKNEHAEGAHNAGYAKKEVSAVFRRFVDECQMVSATMATHPFVEGRFKLTGKAGA